jgi:alpha-tubulin suppressor-like RCC1 family protein
MLTGWRQRSAMPWVAGGILVVAVAIVAALELSKSSSPGPASEPINASLRLPPGTAPTLSGKRGALRARIVAIAAGDYSTCAAVTGGATDEYCWGDGVHHQLGSSTKAMRLTPAPVTGLHGRPSSIDVGGSHACAVVASTAVCWGANPNGEVGAASHSGADVIGPTPVRGLHAAVQVVTGVAHSCALTADGDVTCWGADTSGQLGNGTISRKATPTRVDLPARARSLTAGLAHTCAVLVDGAVMCWGANGNGQLGDGKTANSAVPVEVEDMPAPAIAVAAGDAHTCALLRDGRVACWGWNLEGQLGSSGGDTMKPVLVVGLPSRANAISAGGSDTCAVVQRGAVYCWGANLYGQLGNATTTDSYTPVAVTGLASGATAIATGLYHSCALVAGGALTCWGSNDQGQLGNGTTSSSSTPVNVTGFGLAPDGAGTMSASPETLQGGAGHTDVKFMYRAAPGGMHDGTLVIEVPAEWSAPSTHGRAPGYATSTHGHVTASGQTITVTGLTLAGGESTTIEYGSRALGGPGALAPLSGTSVWQASEQSTANGTLTPLRASPAIALVPPNGTGRLTTPTTFVPNGARSRTLDFVYAAQTGGITRGQLTIVVPPGWSAPSRTPGSAGYVTASAGTVGVAGRTISISDLTLGPRETLKIRYANAAGPSTNVGSQVWDARERSGPSGQPRPLASPPVVSVLPLDGSGQATSTPSFVPSGAAHFSLTFTYDAGPGGMDGGAVAITVPPGWPSPSTRPQDPGYVTSAAGTVAVSGRTIVLGVKRIHSGSSVSVVYGSGEGGGPRLSAPIGPGGRSVWTVEERSSTKGRLTKLTSPISVTILSPDGSGALLRATGPATAGSRGNTVVFAYVAAPGGLADGRLELTVPTGWSAPSMNPNDPGYVSAGPGGVKVEGRTIVVSGLSLRSGEEVLVVYGNRAHGGPGANAPRTDATGAWPVSEQSDSSGTLKPLRAH